jgi:ADP-ribosylglycohydrolase
MSEQTNRSTQTQIPADHTVRMERALLSFDGLSVGDGFGECFFTARDIIHRRLAAREAPPAPWTVTDDTMMAVSIVRCLQQDGHIDSDKLAKAFAREYGRDPLRGYGGGARSILAAIGEGVSWFVASKSAFGGQGSCGNGGAMRAAPIGAYFADDIARLILEARASAEVTHAHPDGQTGAIAIALAAAWMVREKPTAPSHALIEFVAENLPQTETYHHLMRALRVKLELSPAAAASILGSGVRVISSDTVPFCLWCAARHPNDYVEALWTTVAGLGDRDTTCAIVGGIVALGAGRESIPADWLSAREKISL